MAFEEGERSRQISSTTSHDSYLSDVRVPMDGDDTMTEQSILLSRSTVLTSAVHSMSSLSSPDYMSATSKDVKLIWNNVNYLVDSTIYKINLRKFKRRVHLQVLRNVSGHIESGKVTAFLGPSGAGKTTLLECIAGRRTIGIQGDIYVTGCKAKPKVSFVYQKDHLIPQLTVKETLLFASRVKNWRTSSRRLNATINLDFDNTKQASKVAFNGNLNGVCPGTHSNPDVVSDDNSNEFEGHDDAGSEVKVTVDEGLKNGSNDLSKKTSSSSQSSKTDAPILSHSEIVKRLMAQLGLAQCAHVRVANCSGGQMKRLSIGLELVAKPNVILLDEPTSGLDSSSSLQVVTLMKSLAREGIAVCASIHQPNMKVLNCFDNLYILSHTGRCIYNGPTSALIDYLESFGLHCPKFQTPTDFAIEVASGEYGGTIVHQLACKQLIDNFHETPKQSVSIRKIVEKTKRKKHPIFLHFWLLYWRTILVMIREPLLTTLRLIGILLVATVISFLYARPIGVDDGCFRKPSLDMLKYLNPGFDLLTNIAFIFFSILFITIVSKIPVVLTFSLEMPVFLKERENGWYSCLTYYLAKSAADIPLQIVFPFIYMSISYYFTDQPLVFWRFAYLMINITLVSFITQSVGLALGTLYCHDLNAAIFATALETIPAIIFTGFFVQLANMSSYFYPMTTLNYMKYAFENVLLSIYGFGRCPKMAPNITNPYDTMDFRHYLDLMDFLTNNDLFGDAIWLAVNRKPEDVNSIEKVGGSVVLMAFDINDNMFWPNVAILVGVLLGIRLAAYIILLRKANRKK